MSQFAGDMSSQIMSAQSNWETNAKRKNVVIPKGTEFKNVKISTYYDNVMGHLFQISPLDIKRGEYDNNPRRRILESDFDVTNLVEKGKNFSNKVHYRIIKKNGFDVDEEATIDAITNKDIEISIYDEAPLDFFGSLWKKTTQSIPNNSYQTKSTTEIKKVDEVLKSAEINQSEPNSIKNLLSKPFNLLIIGGALVLGFLAYKKLKK